MSEPTIPYGASHIDVDKLKRDIERAEDRRQFAYDDETGVALSQGDVIVGKITIGIGRNLSDRGLSQDEIDYLFSNDLRLVLGQLDGSLPWWRQMSEVRQRVLVDMCFNMGITTLLTFKNTLGAMSTGRYEQAAVGMMNSKWRRDVKSRADRLIYMMRSGLDPVAPV